ncbi:amidase [Rudaea sp.]|uniref:amidase n=1 Tax=Rudaea sp. TaxID=2136325 RepID=UPI002ED303AA
MIDLAKPRLLAFLFAVLLPATVPAAQPESPPALEEYSIRDLAQKLQRKELNAHALAQQHLDRIAAIDKAGPAINAVIELNPDALAIADRLDAARKSGKVYSPLHGIPVLIKDNIDTADRMHTTAGSLALADSIAAQDATVVAKLRAAGAVILGKTNLSEWANFRSNHSTSGWSGRGGLTKNPYALDRNACGSSSGTGAAIAANLAVAGIGTETDGSIVCPASANGIVGIKPTLGLVSRAGIVPIAHSQDTAGPMARSVADAAILLGAIAGSDSRDAATKDADKHRTDYTKALDAKSLHGARIGVVRQFTGFDPATEKLFDAAIARLKAAGAIVVDPVELPNLGKYDDDEGIVLQYEFKADINAYLAQLAPGAKARSLADLIAFNEAHADGEMSWFGQETFEKSQKRGTLQDKEYLDALARSKRLAGPEGIDAALAKDHLDALIAPTSGPAWTTDLVNGDHFSGSSSTPAAVAGYPAVTLPMGFVHHLPVGISFFGTAWSDAKLIGYAYAFEQATLARRPPRFLPHIENAD